MLRKHIFTMKTYLTATCSLLIYLTTLTSAMRPVSRFAGGSRLQRSNHDHRSERLVTESSSPSKLSYNKASAIGCRGNRNLQPQHIRSSARTIHARSNSSPTALELSAMSLEHGAVSMLSNILIQTKRASSSSSSSVLRASTTSLRGGAIFLASAAPQLSTWIVPAFACASSYALYNLFIKKASSSIDPILGGVLLQFVAALIGTMLLLVQRTTKAGALQYTKSGLVWSLAAGAAVGAAELLSFVINGMGVQATQSIPVIVGGSILIGTLLGALWLQERLTRAGWIGVILIALGIVLVGMDPGSNIGH